MSGTIIDASVKAIIATINFVYRYCVSNRQKEKFAQQALRELLQIEPDEDLAQALVAKARAIENGEPIVSEPSVALARVEGILKRSKKPQVKKKAAKKATKKTAKKTAPKRPKSPTASKRPKKKPVARRKKPGPKKRG